MRPGARPAVPCLMLVTRPMADPDHLVRIVAAAVSGGVDLVQLRDREAPIDAVMALAVRLREVIEGRALLLINHPEWRRMVAVVDGVHLPENDRRTAARSAAVPPIADRQEPGTDPGFHPGTSRVQTRGSTQGGAGALLFGRSIHSREAATAAVEEGADYLVAGTIFATKSHPGVRPAGLSFLREVCASVNRPVFAIGGVTPENAADCIRAGAAGVAVLSPLMDAAEPAAVATAYRTALCTVALPSGVGGSQPAHAARTGGAARVPSQPRHRSEGLGGPASGRAGGEVPCS